MEWVIIVGTPFIYFIIISFSPFSLLFLSSSRRFDMNSRCLAERSEEKRMSGHFCDPWSLD